MKTAALTLLLGVSLACTDSTPVGTILGERDFSSHIPAADRGRVTTEEHGHQFAIAEAAAKIDLLLTTGEDSTTGAAWVRKVRFVVASNDGLEIQPASVSGPLNMGTPEAPVASYAFHVTWVRESFGKTTSGTTAGRFAGDGSFRLE